MQTIIQKKNANLETVKFNNKYITVLITIKVVSLICRCSSVYSIQMSKSEDSVTSLSDDFHELQEITKKKY